MKKMLDKFGLGGVVTLVVVVLLVIGMMYNAINAEGIVILPGYEHGVAMCDGGVDDSFPIMHQEDEFHMWQDKGITYVINWGHLSDKQVGELEVLASTTCEQYQK